MTYNELARSLADHLRGPERLVREVAEFFAIREGIEDGRGSRVRYPYI